MKKFLSVLIFLTFLGSSFSLFTIGTITFSLFRVVFLVFLLCHFLNKKKSIKTPVAQKYTTYLGLIIFLNFFTLFQTPSISSWFNGCIFYAINIALIYFIYVYTESMADIKIYVHAYLLGILLTIVVAIYEYVSGNHIADNNYFDAYIVGSWKYEALSEAPTGFLYNPNNVGVAIVFGLSFGLVYTKNKKGWLLFALWCAASVYVCFATGSRGAILFVFAAILLSVFLGTKSFSKKTSILFLILLVGVIGYLIFGDFIQDRLKTAGFNDNTSFTEEARWELILTSIKASWQSAFLGTGPRTADIVLRENFGLKMSSIHNFWMEFLLNQGIISFVLFVAFYIRCIKVQYALIKTSTISACVLISLLMFVFITFIPPTIITLCFIWVVFGYSLALEKLHYIQTGEII